MQRWLIAAVTLAFGFAALPALPDERLAITLSDYTKRRERATSKESYELAAARVAAVKPGMRSDRLFDAMQMLVVRDKKGAGIDGFMEGYLQIESLAMNKGKEPDKVLVFGYYQDWKKRKGPVKKFYIVVRFNVVQEIAFFDPADDVHKVSARVNP